MYTHFLAIDWSARNHLSPKQPTKDAIWLAEAAANGPITTHYFRTRYACRDYVLKRLTSPEERARTDRVGLLLRLPPRLCRRPRPNRPPALACRLGPSYRPHRRRPR